MPARSRAWSEGNPAGQPLLCLGLGGIVPGTVALRRRRTPAAIAIKELGRFAQRISAAAAAGIRFRFRLSLCSRSAIRTSRDTFSSLFTESVGLGDAHSFGVTVVGVASVAALSELTIDRRLVCLRAAVAFSAVSGTMRRCVLRPLARHHVRRPREGDDLFEAQAGERGSESFDERAARIGAPSRMSFTHAR